MSDFGSGRFELGSIRPAFGLERPDLGSERPDLRSNQSPKGNMWSAIPVALLCMIVNLSKEKQGAAH